jgi:hypothetical protein
MTETQTKVIQWLARGEVGTSSKCMAMWLAFGEIVPEKWPPGDPGDLRRCLRLLAWAPGLRPLLPKMAEVSDQWSALTARWDEVEALFLEESGFKRWAPRTFDLMKTISRSVEKEKVQ